MSSPAANGADRAGSLLVVEDDEPLADLYAKWLEPDHDVAVAHDGRAGLDAMSDDVDVVLLDRRMPVMSGDEFLQALTETSYDASVAMVTAVDPGVDVLDLPFDDYVTKPVTRGVMLDVVDRLLRLRGATGAVRRYHSLERRRDILRDVKARTGETDMEAFDVLTRRLEAAARDAGAGLAWLREEYYGVES